MPSSLRVDVVAGMTTFFTMAYIVVVNPAILASTGTGMAFSGVMTATVLLAFTMTLLMGFYAKLPFAVAPGMGINAFFTYSLILGQGVPWQVALGAVFWAGVLFLLASLTPFRVAIAKAIPDSLRSASAVGIGIFLTFIGLKNSGFIVADPVTFVKLGVIDGKIGLSLCGMALMVFLLHRKSPLAFLIGIFGITAVAWMKGYIKFPAAIFSYPDFNSVFFKLDVWSALKVGFIPAIVSIFFTDLFDSISTFVGVSHATGMVDENGEAKNLKEGLIVDAWATLCAGIFGTSSGTAYIESVAGIEMGGRSGRVAIVTALCFLPCFFLAPLAAMVPSYATAPVLVIVGSLMFRSVSDLPKSHKIEETLPAFMTIVLIPLTFSITQGILWGFVSHVVLFLMVGRGREIPKMLYGIAAVSILLLAVENIKF